MIILLSIILAMQISLGCLLLWTLYRVHEIWSQHLLTNRLIQEEAEHLRQYLEQLPDEVIARIDKSLPE
jgi:hypothetical protein